MDLALVDHDAQYALDDLSRAGFWRWGDLPLIECPDRQINRSAQCSSFVDGFFVFEFGDGVGDDSACGLDVVGPSAVGVVFVVVVDGDDHGAQGECDIHFLIERDPA